MVKNIQSMYKGMTKEVKKEVVAALMQEFDKNDFVIKQTWIYNGNVPEKNQSRVVEIMQNALIEQSNNSQKLATLC